MTPKDIDESEKRLTHADPTIRLAAVQALGAVVTSLSSATMASLVVLLDDACQHVRHAAIKALMGVNTQLPEHAINQIANRLVDEDEWRDNKTLALAALGQLRSPLPERAIEILVSKIDDRDAGISGAAIDILVEARPPLSADSVRSLACSLIYDEYPTVRTAAAQLLGMSDLNLDDEAVDALINGTRDDEDHNIREWSTEAVAKQVSRFPDKVTEALLFRLSDDCSSVRDIASRALTSIGPPASETMLTMLLDEYDGEQALVETEHPIVLSALSSLVSRLDAPDATLRAKAMKALERMAPFLPDVTISVLTAKLEHEDSSVRRNVLTILYESGHSPTAESLSASLTDEEAATRVAAVQLLSNDAWSTPWVRTALLERMQDSDPWVRASAVEVLKDRFYSSMPEDAIDAVLAKLSDEDSSVRVAAVEVFHAPGRPMSEHVLTCILARLEDPDPSVRAAAAESIANLNPSLADRAIDMLVARLTDESVGVRRASVVALGSRGWSLPETAIDALVGRLSDADVGVQDAATKVFGQQEGPLKQNAVVALVQLLSGSRDVRKAAARALIDTKSVLSSQAESIVLSVLRHEDEDVRRTALKVLSTCATLSGQAIDALLSQLKDSDPEARRTILEGLARIGPAMPEHAYDILVRVLNGGNEEERELSARALGDRPIPERALE